VETTLYEISQPYYVYAYKGYDVEQLIEDILSKVSDLKKYIESEEVYTKITDFIDGELRNIMAHLETLYEEKFGLAERPSDIYFPKDREYDEEAEEKGEDEDIYHNIGHYDSLMEEIKRKISIFMQDIKMKREDLEKDDTDSSSIWMYE
jgi:hypothetical protein